MVFPSPTSTRYRYGHINGVPVLHSLWHTRDSGSLSAEQFTHVLLLNPPKLQPTSRL
ncbi:hypothetical protein Hanom_Chr03g00242601 [Helianthus anomalus]